jgi:ATP-dependent helicase/nuclease subunit A
MMVSRMVALLGAEPGKGCACARNLAAVTFTRKAAAELRANFQVALEKAADGASGPAGKRLSEALENIDQCFIGTIHSFCARLLRERPVEAGVDLDFEELDQNQDRRAREEAWDLFFALARSSPDEQLLELERLGVDLADLKDAYMRFTEYPDVDRWPAPDAAAIERLMSEAPGQIREYVAYMKDRAGSVKGGFKTETLLESFQRVPEIIEEQIGDLGDDECLIEALEVFKGTKKIAKTGWPGKGICEMPGAGDVQEDEYWKQFCEKVRGPLYEARYPLAIHVLLRAARFYADYKSLNRKLNFQDLLMKAARLLRENTDARRSLAAKYTHLLVDEFQDTDPIQAEVMFLLTAGDTASASDEAVDWRMCEPRPGSLFVVGDPKQSIYRFRRADIKTYNFVRNTLCPGESDVVRLTSNFRSVPGIIGWVNDVFAPDSDTPDPMTPDLMLKFPREPSDRSPQYAMLEPGSSRADGTLSGVFRLMVSKGDADDYEAETVARLIRHACDGGMTVARTQEQLEDRKRALDPGDTAHLDPGELQAVDYADFLIIARNTTHLARYARKLQAYGIPHRVTGGSALNEVPELKLLHLLLTAAAKPDDPVALLACLRSELFGVSDTALYSFKGAGGRFSFSSDVPTALEPEAARAFSEAFAMLRSSAGLLRTLPAVAAIEQIASDTGLMAWSGVGPGGDVNAGSIAKAMEILRSVQADSWATVQVVDYLGALIEPARAKEEKYDGVSALSMDKPAVRLMNLHQVKGLQAPVVFLVDPTGENDFRGHPVDLHVDRDEEGTDDKVGIRGYLALSKSKGDYASETVAYTDGWKGAGGLEKREETFQVAEHLRLRYVAATRAGSALVVSVTAEDIENAARDIEAGAARPSRNPWGHFAPYLTPASGVRDISELLPYPGEETGAKARVPAAAGAGKFDPDAARERLRGRLLLMQTHDYETAAAKEWALRGTESSGEPETLFAVESLEQPQPPGEHGVEWGTIVHRLLELAPSSREELERIARDLLIEHDLDPGLAHAAAALVESVTTSDLWARSLSSSMRLVEVPFEVLLEKEAAVPTVVRGSVDLAFKEDGGWVLVDYKTDRVGRDNVQALLQKYEAQLRMYQEAWTRCTGEPVAEIGIYLVSDGRYFPL